MQLFKVNHYLQPSKLFLSEKTRVEKGVIRYRGSLLSWQRYGSGVKPVLCFHGYGETAESFSFLENTAGDQFSFFAIDLPFHGSTEWKSGSQFTINDLSNIVALIPGILHGDKISLLGFSMGGRIALSFFQNDPSLVKKIVLLAPDGLKINFWYWLATQTRMGNRFFHFTMKYPGWFFSFLKFLNKLGLVNSSIFKFVNFYIGEEQVRSDLYNRWTVLRKLRPDLKKIKSCIKQYGVKLSLVYGKHDRIIVPKRGEKFRKSIGKLCTIDVIESGHQVLQPKNAEIILRHLMD